MEPELDNLRAALDWLPEHGAVERALSLAGSLWRFWWLREHRTEAHKRCEALLARPDAQAPTIGRARALISAGELADTQGERELAVAHLDEALGIFRALGDCGGIATALLCVYAPLLDGGDYERALAAITESLAIFRELDDAWGIAVAYMGLGIWPFDLEWWDGEKSPTEECLAIARAMGNPSLIAGALNNLGVEALDWRSGEGTDLARGEALYEESLSLLRELDCKGPMSLTLVNLGALRRLQGDIERAAALLEQGLTLARETGNKGEVAQALMDLGITAYQMGDHRRAVHLIREGLTMFHDLKSTRHIPFGLDGLVTVVGGTQAERAARLLGAADRLRAVHPNRIIFWSDLERDEHERDVAKVRAALGEAAFIAAWEAGQALSLDAVLAEVAALETALLAEQFSLDGQRPPPPPFGLTPRELDVLRLVAAGHSDRAIADALSISRRTASNHVSHILAKLDVETRTAAVGRAVREGLA